MSLGLLQDFSLKVSKKIVLRGEVVSFTPSLQPGGPCLRMYTPGAGLPSYTPGHWVARVPRDHHFPYPLTWAPEGEHICSAWE
jgi:hypothetical protein